MKLVPWTEKADAPTRLWPDTTRLFEEFFSDRPFLSPFFQRTEAWRPPVDILEKDGNLILRAEVPGVPEKDIELKIEGNVLTMRGEKKQEFEEKKDGYHRMESYYGEFSRSFTLPETVDCDKIKADYRNGVLTITIPQKPEVKPRAIPVTTH